MKIEFLSSGDLLEHKSTILAFLVESYKVNFNLSQELCTSVCKEKFNLLNTYLKQDSATLIGAFNKEELIGFVWLYKQTNFGEQRLHINQIIVSQEHRGKGIAKQLIKEAERFAINNEIKTMDLNVSEINVEAIKMYDNIGFSTERRLMKKVL
ncbi:GNAT family N-acetyltransferase [Oceanobacillus profundus]|uniref:GNAT family N-acetyltransferase n=1 Tax=Oceanobacillus profundus TaxID=372463 RepID=UPI00203D9D4A|nr:GNAT family N-acetyltransferase [Oceanobacillus profundus]MCM3399461.1 GNAT family N-acetyltransferase [Oceanobacillus profundus]